jgi:hypothetical protein
LSTDAKPTTPERTRPVARELLIIAGFVVLVGVAVVTVLIPALRDDAAEDDEQATPAAGAAATPADPAATPAPPTAPVGP